jgi:hypothetical protein
MADSAYDPKRRSLAKNRRTIDISMWGQEEYFFLMVAISPADSTHSSQKPQDAQRYRVTPMELKNFLPTVMLFPAP